MGRPCFRPIFKSFFRPFFNAIELPPQTLLYPDWVVDTVSTPLLDWFNIDQDIRDFLVNQYLPEVLAL